VARWRRLRLTFVSGFPRLWRNIRRPCSVSTPRSANRTRFSAGRSTGITRLRRYYEPLRHPARPGLSLAGVQLAVTRRHRQGFLCCVGLLLQTCHRPYPGGPVGIYRSPESHSGGLPHPRGESASTSLLSRSARRSLTLRPACSRDRHLRSFPSKAPTASLPPPPLRLLPAGATSCRVGFAPTENQHLSQRTRG
jgi:hypothetical protein